MAIEIKPIVMGSKKATSALLGGISSAGFGFVVFVVSLKWLLLGFNQAMMAGMVFGLMAGGGLEAIYPILEGIRDAIGKGKN
jgi:hypothetical protein